MFLGKWSENFNSQSDCGANVLGTQAIVGCGASICLKNEIFQMKNLLICMETRENIYQETEQISLKTLSKKVRPIQSWQNQEKMLRHLHVGQVIETPQMAFSPKKSQIILFLIFIVLYSVLFLLCLWISNHTIFLVEFEFECLQNKIKA